MIDDTVITRRKKSGFPNRCLFDDSQVVHSFSKISRALADSKNYPTGLKIDERSLANVSFQLQTFMELTLGKSAAKLSRTITKIPLGAFRDFTVDGSLMGMLSVALKHQMKAGWKVFDLSLPERFSSGVKIIHDAEAILVEVSTAFILHTK